MRIHSAFVFLVFLGLGGCAQTSLQDFASEPGLQVGVMISGDAATTPLKFLISRDADSMTALEVLQETGAELITLESAFGTAICSIAGVGQPFDDCFGDPEGEYWAFFIRESDTSWNWSDIGASAYTVADGDVLAFYWTASNLLDPDYKPLRQPPPVKLDEFEG